MVRFGPYSFEGSGLTEIEAPKLAIIDEGALQYSTGLSGTLTLKDTMMFIGDYAFAACKSLTSIIIPDSVTNIGKGAFNGCNDLVITLESNKHFIIIDDMLYTSNKDLLIRCNSKKKKDVVILESIKNIGDYAFVGCKLLANITIPNSVINIGESAFRGCESLTNITIPDSVTNIGGRAFDGCKLLADIIIPNSVTSIGLGAFWSCNSLNNIYVYNGSVDKFKKLLPENLHNKLIEI